MYIPANVLRTLTSPESLAYEVKRRKLKAALSDAAQAVKLHTYPASPERPLSIVGIIAFEKRLAKDVFRAEGTVSGRLSNFAQPNSPEMKQYNESVAFRDATAKYRAEHKKLKQSEADARAAYHAYVTPSDLE
jgi:hypothetical protein